MIRVRRIGLPSGGGHRSAFLLAEAIDRPSFLRRPMAGYSSYKIDGVMTHAPPPPCDAMCDARGVRGGDRSGSMCECEGVAYNRTDGVA